MAGAAGRLGAAFRATFTEGLQRTWLVTRFSCYLLMFHDYVAEATLVRTRAGVCGSAHQRLSL